MRYNNCTDWLGEQIEDQVQPIIKEIGDEWRDWASIRWEFGVSRINIHRQLIQDVCLETVGSEDGLIMIHEFILDNAKDGPEFPALFSLNMLINNPRGRAYSEKELGGMLENSGIKNIARHPYQGPNNSSILCGTI